MKKLRLSVRRLSWVSLTSLLLGIVTLAFSQLATQPEAPAGDASAQVGAIRQTLQRLEASMSDVRSAQASLRRRTETDRLARDIAQTKNGLSGLDAATSAPLAQRVTQIEGELVRVEGELDMRQGETARTLSGVEGRFQESKGIFKDALENSGGNVEEVLPILRIVAQNLGKIENELQAVAQLVDVGEKEGGRSVGALAQQVAGVLDEIAKARVADEAVKPQSEAVATAPPSVGSQGVSDAVRSIQGETTGTRFDPAIRSESANVGVARQAANERNLSEAAVDQLRSQLAASRNVQAALSEDTEKLQSDLRRAYREIVSLQSGLKESEHLVKELEESRMALLKARGQNASGVEAVSRMVSRLESELKSSRDELSVARKSLLSEQDRSNTMIRTLSTELERTRKELDSARAAAAVTGADAGRLLTLEQELDRTRRALVEAKATQVTGDPEVSNKLRDELRKALTEITRLQAELNGKEELEEQLTTMRETIKQMSESPSRAISAEYVNKLLLELNAAKVAVDKAKAESENLRAQLSGKIKDLHGNIGQSQVDLDKSRLDLENAREIMARREFEFASTIKKLEDELQETQVALQEATQGAIRKVPVVGDMEKTLSDSQARIDALTRRFDQEQAKAGELVSALQLELETTKRRHEATLEELFEKEKQIKGQEHEMQRNRKEAAGLKAELGEVENIANQLQQLNDILDETKKTQNSQVSDADRIISSLREQINEAQVELVFAKEAKEKAEESAASQVVALEHQLEQTREQLAATQSNMYDRAAGSKELIQDLKVELDEARKEIARLKTMGAGDSVGAQQAVGQLQEALGTIRVLQESLDQAEEVNAQVDGLRAELANAMQSQLTNLEKAELDKERLRKKVADLELEVKVLAEAGSGRNVNYAKAMAGLSEKLQASQNQVARLEAKLARSENSGVGTISGLEEELEAARNRNNELQAQMQQALQGKGRTLELLERELALANQKLDDMEAQQSAVGSPEMAKLERRLISAKLLLDEMAKQRGEGDPNAKLAEQLKIQLMAAESKVAALEAASKGSGQASLVGNLNDLSRLEDDLANAQNTISDLQQSLEAKELEHSTLQTQLAKAIQGMEAFKQAGQDTANLRTQLEALRSQLALASSGSPSATNPGKDSRVAQLKAEIESLKAELELARELAARSKPNGASSPAPGRDLRVTELRGEIESLKAELELARELASRPGQTDPASDKLRNDLADKVGEVMDLTTELNQVRKQLSDLQSLKVLPPVSPDSSVEVNELKNSLSAALAQLQASDAQRASDKKKLDELTESLSASQGLQSDLLRLQRELAVAKAESSAPLVDPEVDRLRSELGQTKEALQQSESKVGQLKGLGDDLVLLQKDLLMAKNEQAGLSPVGTTDSVLQTELLKSQQDLRKSEADVARLNDDIRGSMQDFGLLKGQIAALRAENDSLKATAKASPIESDANNDRTVLARENSNLRIRLQEHEARISKLREDMANMSATGAAPNESELRARLLQSENQLDAARSAEQRAKLDFQRSDEELKEANRRLILLEDDLRIARSRAAELEAVKSGLVPPGFSPPIRPSTAVSSAATSALNQLQVENDRLKRELAMAQSGGSRDAVSREVQELRNKQLISAMQIEREQTTIANLQKQLRDATQVKRENFEKDRAQRQRITLQDEELTVARSRVAELEGAVVAMREAIRVLREGGSGDTRIPSLASSPPSPRTSATPARVYPSPSSGRGVGGGYASTPRVSSLLPRTKPLPLPSRSGRGSPTRVARPLGVLPSRPSIPVARSVPRGEGTLEVTATVQFLNNKDRPAGDIEFFVLSEDFDAVVKRAGINLPVEQGITSPSELWARSVRSGYRYPGVASHIRNALADANLARIKTNARGLATVGSLAPGNYHLVGTAPFGRVGVVWSEPFNIESGKNKLNLDLRNASWAQ